MVEEVKLTALMRKIIVIANSRLKGMATTWLISFFASGMSREVHVPICERLAGKFRRPTRRSPKGTKAGAVFYSLIRACKASNIEPYQYFTAMLHRIRVCKTEEDYRQLLPQFIQSWVTWWRATTLENWHYLDILKWFVETCWDKTAASYATVLAKEEILRLAMLAQDDASRHFNKLRTETAPPLVSVLGGSI